MDWINQVHYGDCRNTMRAMIADGFKVQMCVTSPPYWGLRDYGTAKWNGGTPYCNHKESTARNDGGRNNVNGFHGSTSVDSDKGVMNYRNVCAKCGAVRIDKQLGLEPTPEEYVANMVEVFSLVRELLADDGTLWLNLGDSYSGSGVNDGTKSPGLSNAAARGNPVSRPGATTWNCPLKPKDLVGIPWMVAFALRSVGWWLRSDIIWHKPSCMPESVTDRPTKSHEYLFLLAKSQKYFYDAEAVREKSGEVTRLAASFRNGGPYTNNRAFYNSSSNEKETHRDGEPGIGRNRRTVWTVNPKPYTGSHFATFPPKLIEPCILAGSRLGDVVFDPFMGSGTTAMVAERLGRKWIGCELNEKYKPLIDERTAQLGLGI